jgi:hypothetical protein
MLAAEQLNTIHRLHFAERWSMRKIAVAFECCTVDLNVFYCHWLRTRNDGRHIGPITTGLRVIKVSSASF